MVLKYRLYKESRSLTAGGSRSRSRIVGGAGAGAGGEREVDGGRRVNIHFVKPRLLT